MNIYNFIAGVIALAGIGVSVKVLTVFYFYKFTLKKWVKTGGEVVNEEVVYFKSKSDADTEGWKHKVDYKFYVKNHEYSSNIITKNIGYLAPSKELVRDENFSKGQSINVYYNPKNPKQSILDNKFNYNSLFLLIVTLISLYVANLISSQHI